MHHFSFQHVVKVTDTKRSIQVLVLFFALSALGLLYVKWWPYFHRALEASQTHSIGASILTAGQASIPGPSFHAALNYAAAYGKAIWKALVLGLLLGSAIQVLLPGRWITSWLGNRRRGILTGSLLAVPSMMCTCCAAPVINGLRKNHAGPGSALAYWLGNTMLNPATLVFMGFVLGWHWAGLRLVLGVVMVFGLAWLIHHANCDPLASDLAAAVDTLEEPASFAGQRPGEIFKRWLQVLGGMCVRLLPEYLIIVMLLGALRAWLFPVMDISVDNSLLWILAFAVVGALFVIPTAGEVPIVQAMLALGVGVGPAAALLVTLPPVSLPSLLMVARSFRWRDLALLLLGVVALGVFAAILALALGF